MPAPLSAGHAVPQHFPRAFGAMQKPARGRSDTAGRLALFSVAVRWMPSTYHTAGGPEGRGAQLVRIKGGDVLARAAPGQKEPAVVLQQGEQRVPVARKSAVFSGRPRKWWPGARTHQPSSAAGQVCAQRLWLPVCGTSILPPVWEKFRTLRPCTPLQGCFCRALPINRERSASMGARRKPREDRLRRRTASPRDRRFL